MINDRQWAIATVGAMLAAPALAVAQSAAPSRPITLVVPFASGGPAHFLGRLLAVRLSRALGEPVVVENRPGQSGLAGTCFAGEAAADGRTLLLATNGVYAVTMNISSCRFEFSDALTPLGLVARTPLVLCVSAASPIRSLADLTRAARAAPGALRYITTQAYALPMLLLSDMLEISLTSVLVGGTLAGIETMAQGGAQLALLELGAAIPLFTGGMIHALGVSSTDRVPQLPELPTLIEAGLPGFEAATDYALFTRAGTSEAVLERLEQAAINALSGNDTRTLLSPIGVEVVAGTRAAFPAYFEAENRKWLNVIRQFDIHSMEHPR